MIIIGPCHTGTHCWGRSETSGSNEGLIPRVISIELGEVFGPAERAWLPDGELRPHHCVPVRLSRIDNQNGE